MAQGLDHRHSFRDLSKLLLLVGVMWVLGLLPFSDDIHVQIGNKLLKNKTQQQPFRERLLVLMYSYRKGLKESIFINSVFIGFKTFVHLLTCPAFIQYYCGVIWRWGGAYRWSIFLYSNQITPKFRCYVFLSLSHTHAFSHLWRVLKADMAIE